MKKPQITIRKGKTFHEKMTQAKADKKAFELWKQMGSPFGPKPTRIIWPESRERG